MGGRSVSESHEPWRSIARGDFTLRFTVANWAIAKLVLNHLISVRGENLSEIIGSSASAGSITADGAIKVDIESPYQKGVDYTLPGAQVLPREEDDEELE